MSIRAGILTVSDKGAAGERVDTAGPAVAGLLDRAGAHVNQRLVLPDERDAIAACLRQWADAERLDLIVTTGGTGLSLRDVTPEATLDVIDRQVPGLAEVMREAGRRSTPLAALSRAVCGTRGRTLILNLPGSERGARESLEAVIDLLPHAIDLLQGEATTHPVGG
jgi:molybdenum cofactor synthesis domain-containing protein